MSYDPAQQASRRALVVERMRRRGGGVMLLPAAEEKLRNADAEYVFRQDSDFAYATGFEEPTGCALLYTSPAPPPAGDAAQGDAGAATAPPADAPGSGPAPDRYVLFVRPKDPEREIWTGRRAGVEGARAVYGATEAYPASEIDARLPALLDGAGTLFYELGHDPAWDARVARALVDLRSRARAGARAPEQIVDAGALLHEMRLFKEPEELRRLRKAAEITAEAHLAAMREGRAGRRESQVQAEIEYVFRRRGGAGPGYGTIVAAGANSTILHYRAGDDVLEDGQVCLVDAGGEYALYTADVTRTFPVSGRFTRAQQAAYEMVLGAQVEGIAAVRPGATVDGVHDLVLRRLVQGMIDLGLLAGSVEERVADKSYRKYYMHRTSHWLGMDVHDVGAYAVEGEPRPLEPGMVLTIEPGLYVPSDDVTAPEGLRGVGIRIEDDVLVTPDGQENLTAAAPKTMKDLEIACAR